MNTHSTRDWVKRASIAQSALASLFYLVFMASDDIFRLREKTSWLFWKNHIIDAAIFGVFLLLVNIIFNHFGILKSHGKSNPSAWIYQSIQPRRRSRTKRCRERARLSRIVLRAARSAPATLVSDLIRSENKRKQEDFWFQSPLRAWRLYAGNNLQKQKKLMYPENFDFATIQSQPQVVPTTLRREPFIWDARCGITW